MREFARTQAALAAATALCAAGAPMAARAMDATLLVEGGSYDQDGQKVALGAGFAEARLRGPIDAPVTYQIEIRAGQAHADLLGGIALRGWTHLGARTRVGAFAAVADRDGGYDEIGQAGLEFEFYAENAILHVDAGYQDGDPRNDHGFVGVEAIWGMTDDLMLSVGGDFISGDDDLALATLTWRPMPYSMPGLNVFVRGEHEPSDNSYTAAYLGVSMDTGAPTAVPLIARRRDVGAPGRLARTLRPYMNDAS